MLKVQPWFRLDRSYKGPFRVKLLIATNAVIVLEGSKSPEPWYVSRKHLSKCIDRIDTTQPWVGCSNRLRRHVKLRREPIHSRINSRKI